MTTHNNEYNAVAKTLHWLLAILICAEWMVGATLDTTSWYWLHFQTGALILVLVVARIVWKVVAGHPPMDDSLTALNKLGATLGHSVLYLLMLFVPVLGLVLVFTHGEPVSLLGIPFPAFVDQPWPHATRHLIKEVHEAGAFGLVMLAIAHGLVAIVHYIRHKSILGRMVPRCIMNLIEKK